MRLLNKLERAFLEDLGRNGRMPVNEYVAQYKELDPVYVQQFVNSLPNYFLSINPSGVYALIRDAAQRRVLEFYSNMHHWDRQPPEGWSKYELHIISQFLDRGMLSGPEHNQAANLFDWPHYKQLTGFKLDLTAKGRAMLALGSANPVTVRLEQKGLIVWDRGGWRLTKRGRDKLGRPVELKDWEKRERGLISLLPPETWDGIKNDAN